MIDDSTVCAHSCAEHTSCFGPTLKPVVNIRINPLCGHSLIWKMCSELNIKSHSTISALSVQFYTHTCGKHCWLDSTLSMWTGAGQSQGRTCFGSWSVADRLRSFGQGDEERIVNVLIICFFSLSQHLQREKNMTSVNNTAEKYCIPLVLNPNSVLGLLGLFMNILITQGILLTEDLKLISPRH